MLSYGQLLFSYLLIFILILYFNFYVFLNILFFLQVLLGIFFPPYILAMEFKSKEELQLMPQTMEEHLDELDSELSDNENMSVSSFEDDQVNN